MKHSAFRRDISALADDKMLEPVTDPNGRRRSKFITNV